MPIKIPELIVTPNSESNFLESKLSENEPSSQICDLLALRLRKLDVIQMLFDQMQYNFCLIYTKDF